LKSFFSWILKNSWNLFGAIGVTGTFYFSLMYVPDYVKDIATSKVTVVHESLMDDIQELIFYEKAISISDVKTFIRGKELKQGVEYPFTSEELLVQIQERFMGNKFIPLEKRESILKSISTIRSQYTQPQKKADKAINWVPIFSWIFSGLGVLVGLLGATSIINKLKTDKETEADIISGDVIISHNVSMSSAAFEYEKMVGDVLSELGVLKANDTNEYDFLAGNKGKEVIVEVKKYRSLVGLGTARKFLHQVLESGKGGILITSSGVTKRTIEVIAEHNKITETQNVFLVTGDTKESVKSQLAKLFEV
jgi:hypothetical protein